MARGITESDVHGATDALVAAGERTTVERIRAHLGTGSPNTVVRWLETWWQGLGDRIASDRQPSYTQHRGARPPQHAGRACPATRSDRSCPSSGTARDCPSC